MRYENVMVGADPELFLVDNNGHLKSAIGLIGGSKRNPRMLDDKGSAVQEDNVAVEFNIPPATTAKEFKSNITNVMEYLAKYVGESGLLLNIVPAALFPDSELQNPKALEFGCDPDYNVWTRAQNDMAILPPELRNLRSCGGHIHISWDINKDEKQEEWPHHTNIERAENVVKAMDLFVGCSSIQQDGDNLRRKLYGKAGAFRFKPYGVEYRTLSNFWLREESLVDWVYEHTLQAIDFLNADGKIDSKHSSLINKCINTGNEHSLLELQKYYPI